MFSGLLDSIFSAMNEDDAEDNETTTNRIQSMETDDLD